MKKKQTTRLLILSVLACTLLLSACGGNQGGSQSSGGGSDAAGKDVLTIAHFSEVVTLDPHGTQSTGSNLVKVNIFENLVKQDADGTILPELAESWTQKDDKTYTFKLREDVYFSNGEQMTAEDVVFSLSRSAQSSTTSALAGMIDYENCKAVDEFTVEVSTLEPYAPILAHLAQECIAIVSKAVTEENNGNLDLDPVGTGPYMLSEWASGDHLTLVENPHYWGEKPSIPTVVLRLITEGSTRTLELESGTVDIVLDLPATDVARIEANDGLVVDKMSNFYNYHCYMNQANEYLQNENIRKAISCALDRESIASVISEGNKKALYGYLCSGVWGYSDDIEKYTYDVERAKEYMAAAGYPDGGFEISIATSSANEYITACEIMQNMLSEIGIDLKIVTADSAGMVDMLYSYNFDMALNCWVAVAGDPDYGLYPMYHSTMTGSGNLSQIKDPVADELLEKGRYEADAEKRAAIYAELQQYLAEKAYDLPMWEDVNINAYQSYVKGFENDANKFYHFSTVYFE